MAPRWLYWVSVASLCLAALSALVIIADLRRHPQKMAVMNPVWAVTALYFGPAAIWAYWKMGRPGGGHNEKPFWQTTFVGVTHCGAGCTLGDIIAEFFVFYAGIVIGSAFGAALICDYILAFVLGFATAFPMNWWLVKSGIKEAM